MSGTYDSESFQCGSPFVSDISEGYSGTDEFDECNEIRLIGLGLAVGLLALGLAISVPVFVRVGKP